MPAAAAQGEGAVDCKRLPDPRRQKFPPESQAEGAHGRCVGRAGSPPISEAQEDQDRSIWVVPRRLYFVPKGGGNLFCCSRR